MAKKPDPNEIKISKYLTTANLFRHVYLSDTTHHPRDLPLTIIILLPFTVKIISLPKGRRR